MNLSDIGLDVNITLLVAMVGALEYIKRHIPKKSAKFYGTIFILICSVMGFAVAVIDGAFGSKEAGQAIVVGIFQSLMTAFINWGIGTLFYQLIVSKAKQFIESKLPQTININEIHVPDDPNNPMIKTYSGEDRKMTSEEFDNDGK